MGQASIKWVILIKVSPLTRLWQIIPKRSPIILFFYSQVLSLLFF